MKINRTEFHFWLNYLSYKGQILSDKIIQLDSTKMEAAGRPSEIHRLLTQ